MKNETNIYDIDGNIIRKAGDNHRFTIEEIEKLVDELTEKVQKNPENQVYKVYLNNAQRWLFNMYNGMSTEDLKARLSILQDSINNAKSNEAAAEQQRLGEIGEAMEQLRAEYDADQSDSPEVLEEIIEPEEIEEIK